MSLKREIFFQKPRETAGSTTQDRFDYQKDWSLTKLLELHMQPSDYVAVFDYHDDLVILDSETEPTNLQFYQIKGKKSGNWSLTSLLARDKGADGTLLFSILGKMYGSKLLFKEKTARLTFVSNARFDVKLNDKSSSLAKDDICTIDLDDSSRKKIITQLRLEHGNADAPEAHDITFLKVIPLSLSDSKTHCVGQVQTFFTSRYPGMKFNGTDIYRMLFDEIKRRASYDKDISNFEELLAHKAICKRKFDEIVDATGIKKDYDKIWEQINHELQEDGLSFKKRRELKASWKKLELDRMQPNNDYLFKTIDRIKQMIGTMEQVAASEDQSLGQMMESTLAVFRTLDPLPVTYPDNFIRAIILSEIYDK